MSIEFFLTDKRTPFQLSPFIVYRIISFINKEIPSIKASTSVAYRRHLMILFRNRHRELLSYLINRRNLRCKDEDVPTTLFDRLICTLQQFRQVESL